MTTQSPTPNKSGLIPTSLITDNDKPDPIKNKVTVNAFLEIKLMMFVKAAGSGINVLTIIANTKNKINHGMEIF